MKKFAATWTRNKVKSNPFFCDQNIEIRVRAALGERISSVLAAPLSNFIAVNDSESVEFISRMVAEKILSMLKSSGGKQLIIHYLESSFIAKCSEGNGDAGQLLERLLGQDTVAGYRSEITRGIVASIHSPEVLQIINRMIDDLVESLIDRPIGRLDHLIPNGVTEGLCRSLREITTRLLISEVPGVVKSISIKKIVADRIDTFDLLRLEELLLSIMAEQFKYINLFGALLGFVIGCANLIFVLGG